jgi:hypothetical protein
MSLSIVGARAFAGIGRNEDLPDRAQVAEWRS